MTPFDRETAATAVLVDSGLPLSFAQEQLWFLDQLSPADPTYNVPFVGRLHGPLDVSALRRALTALADRHEALRTTISSADGVPFQVVGAARSVRMPVHDFTALDEAERAEAVERAITEEITEPFDLAAGPLCRAVLFRLVADDHVFCLTSHHIVTDGWSQGVLLRELSVLYRAALEGTEPDLAPLPLRYADYARQQRERLTGRALESELAYWEWQLAGLARLDLPSDRPRPAARSGRGGWVVRDLPPALPDSARALAQREQTSLFVVLTAALSVVFAHYTGQDDIPLGVPMPGRADPDLEAVVGMFVNLVVLRADLSGDPSFTELADRITDTSFDAYDHQDVPFEKVVERVQPTRDPSRNPLFQVSVQVLGADNSGTSFSLPGVRTEPRLRATGGSRFDLSLNFYESPRALTVGIEFSTDLFDAWRIAALVDHLEKVLAAATSDPSLTVSQLAPVTGAAADALLASADPAAADPARPDAQPAGAEASPAGSETEHIVARIYADVLALPRTELDANFFDSGGTSLQAMRVISRITAAFGVRLPVRLLYSAADVRAVAARIDELLADR
jgi:acyl carrier protein